MLNERILNEGVGKIQSSKAGTTIAVPENPKKTNENYNF